ncbi:MAG: hypothetical protein LBH25_05040 [Fibromonadaceae bacterium]|jgi:hypothetical protein|nr:hypothetical protein [Fibromonadaceae bacterium]
MTNKMALCVAVFAIVFGQACSKKSERETSEYKDEGTFVGDPDTSVKSDGKFLCDFQWTLGPKNWNYDNASGDNPVNENEKDKEPWCLVPYGESTEFFITTKSDESVVDYVCRDLNAQYSLKNEQEIGIDEDYKTHKQMMCVPINSVVVTAKSPNLNSKEEKLYHIRKIEDTYGIAGHVNLFLVKPVHLSVLWEPIWNTGAIAGFMTAKLDVAKIKEDWKRYMKMAGYNIDIKTIPIAGKLTLPQDIDVLGQPSKMISKYNESERVVNGIGNFFGANTNAQELGETSYTIAATDGYKVEFGIYKAGYIPGNCMIGNCQSGKCVTGTCDPNDSKTCGGGGICSFAGKCEVGSCGGTCVVGINASSSQKDIIKSIENLPNPPSLKYISAGIPVCTIALSLNSSLSITLGISEQDCNSMSSASGENNGKKAQAFSIEKGYVLSDANFFNSKNAGRLLAALLYSKIQNINYRNSNSLWLSSYTDESKVEQPKDDWRKEGSDVPQQQNMQMEFAQYLTTNHSYSQREAYK